MTATALRSLRPDDDAALGSLFADPEVVRWNPGPPTTALTEWRQLNADPDVDFRTWAITDPTDALIGVVSLFDLDPDTGTGEIGFRVLPAARGRGVARSAVALVCSWASQHGAPTTIRLFHAVDNPASCRVAASCGFDLVATLADNWRYGDGQLHDEHRHEWRCRSPEGRP